MIVGDGACGKTCLLIVFSRDEFPEVHIKLIQQKFWQRNRAARYETASLLTACVFVIFRVGGVSALKAPFCGGKLHKKCAKKNVTQHCVATDTQR